MGDVGLEAVAAAVCLEEWELMARWKKARAFPVSSLSSCPLARRMAWSRAASGSGMRLKSKPCDVDVSEFSDVSWSSVAAADAAAADARTIVAASSLS